jgi:chromatin structure-remodeling complex subunit RSC8
MSVAPEESLTDATNVITDSTEADLYSQANIYLAKQTKPVIIPSFAKWFNLNEIHAIEKNSLPDFFSSQSNFKYKNPEIYKTVRNFIINTYRLNPIEYLSITAIRRNIAMDVGSLIRIYGFLSKWGLINYQIDPKTKSFSMGPQFTGHFQITLDKPTGFALQSTEAAVSTNVNEEVKRSSNMVVAINDEKSDEPSYKKQKVSNSITPNVKLNLQLRKNVYDSVDDAFILQDSNTNNPKQVKRVYCSITGNDITETKYHNLKNKSNISLDCFENSQFEDYFKSSDYIKLEKASLNNDSKPWTNSEVLLLLEGIEMFGDDWNLISGHVGSRAKDQCIIKFIQLPIEDTYLFKHITKSSYVEYLKKLKENKTIDLSSLLTTISKNGDSIISSSSSTTTTTTTTTTNVTINSNIQKHANEELENQSKIITSILKLSLRKFELKLQGFMNLESRISDQQKLIETEKENLVLDKMKVKKQCLKVRQQLLKASDIVQAVKGDTTITAEALDSAVTEAISFVDRAISEAKYDPNAASSLIATIKETGDADENNESESESKATDAEKPISVVEPKLYSMWSA